MTDSSTINYLKYQTKYLNEIEGIFSQNSDLKFLSSIEILWEMRNGINTEHTLKLPIKLRL